MGRKRQGGFFFVWFKGDHPPPHVHVFDKNEKLLGRIRLDNYEYMEGGIPPAAAVAIVKEFQQKGIL